MTKKDYKLLAEVIKYSSEIGGEFNTKLDEHRREVMHSFAYVISNDLRKYDPKFDRQRFLTDCGIYKNKAMNLL